MRLHLRFDEIPADLIGKREKIEYKGDDKKIQVFLSNNRLNVVETLDGKSTCFEIQKDGKTGKLYSSCGVENAISGWEDMPMKDTEKLARLINFVVKNANNCEELVKDINRPKS